MGGNIVVRSTLGEGSTFIFTAKFTKPNAVANEHTETGTEATKSLIRIMLVEDNVINQKVARKLLERDENVVVSVFANGLLAVQAMESALHNWDAVLMDVFMPVITLIVTHPYASIVVHTCSII